MTSLVAIFGGHSFSQQRGTSSIQGVVVRSDNDPLSKATVELRNPEATGPDDPALARTQTDGDGKFFLPGVEPGRYRIVASAQGYIRTVHARDLTLAAGHTLAYVRIPMTAAGWIS